MDLPAPYGRGVVTSAPILPNTKLVEVPIASCFNTNCVDSGIKELLAALTARKILCNEDDALALQLIKEKHVLQERSAFAAHIAALPAAVDVPYFFTDDELAAFKGTNASKMGEMLRAQIVEYHGLFAPVVAELAPRSGLPADVFTLDAYKWAISMVTSRFVSLRVERSVLKTMVPFFDMFNHSPVANVQHAYDPRTRSVQIITRQGWDAGQQVFLNYGNIPALRAFWLHGFVVPQPDYESFMLQLMMPATHDHFEQRVALIRRYADLVEAPAPPLLAEIYRQSVLKERKQAATAAAAASAPSKSGGAGEGAAGASAAAAEGAASAATDAESSSAAAAVYDVDDLSALELPPTASDPTFDRWRSHVGSLEKASDGSLGVSVQLYRSRPHTSLFRILRVLHCPGEDLGALESVLRSRPDMGLDIEMEAGILKSLCDSLVKLIREIPDLTPEDTARVDGLLALQRDGVAAMRSLTGRIQVELAGAGKPIRAPRDTGKGRAGAAAADDDDEDDGVMFSAVAPGSKKGAKAGAGKGKAKPASKPAAKAAAPASSAAAAAPAAAAEPAPAGAATAAPAEAAAGSATATAAPLPAVSAPSSHEYRLQCGAYFRSVEKEILTSHVKAMMSDLEELKAIVAQHNVENSRLRGNPEGEDEAAAAPAPEAAPSS